MVSLVQQREHVSKEVSRAILLGRNLATLAKVPRQYVAEMIIVRLFALYEATVEDAACAIVCGAKYCDGSRPNLQRARPTRGFDRARRAMQEFGRDEVRKDLRWSTAREVRLNLTFLLPENEHFVQTLVNHGQFISDLRKTRNHIAHGYEGTRNRFQEVVRNIYGANVHSLSPGRMLLSSRFSPLLVIQWCQKLRVILFSALRA